jgi:hypothetical protein
MWALRGGRYPGVRSQHLCICGQGEAAHQLLNEFARKVEFWVGDQPVCLGVRRGGIECHNLSRRHNADAGGGA